MQERVGIGLVIRVHLAQDVIHVPQVTQVELRRMLVDIDGGAVALDNLAQVAPAGGHHVGTGDRLLDGFVIEAVPLDAGGIDVIIDDLAVRVLLVLNAREVEVAAVMAESVIIGINVLPRPILRGQLAIHRILVGDVLALIILECPREPCVLRPDLNRLENVALRLVDLLVGGHEDADALLVVLFLQCSAFNVCKVFQCGRFHRFQSI